MTVLKTLIAAVGALILILQSGTALAAARIEQLRPERGATHRLCTADRVWCTVRAGDGLVVAHSDRRDTRDVARLALPSNQDDRIDSEPWPSIVRVNLPGEREFALVGVLRTQSEMYSGGGGSLTHLTLFEIRADATDEPRSVLEAPLGSSFMIRACFSRDDERRRRGACHDEYRFRATLMAPPQRLNEARLLYRARADSFPGRRSRQQDSNRDGPLRRGDLVRATDRTCTFERTLTRNPATGALAWNAPLPPCSDYLELQ
jgi:hypothetical protein